MTDGSEFSVIDKLFRPLAGLTPEARGLRDDVAVIGANAAFDLVVTTDAMVEGVHFLDTDPLDKVAQKLLRVNLSDLAAKGAQPYGYQLLTVWPKGMSYEAKTLFVKGLKADQDRFGIDLFGGDTVSTTGPLVVSVTAFGRVPKGYTVSRAGAKAGDRVLVSGTIGQGYLGLKVLQAELTGLSSEHQAEFIAAYQLPVPRLDMAEAVLLNANASMDISDGLLADAGHISEASGVDINIDLHHVPTSLAGRAAIALGVNPIDLVTGGDDYQILCTAYGDKAMALKTVGFSDIGECVSASGAPQARLFAGGKPIEVELSGWVHN